MYCSQPHYHFSIVVFFSEKLQLSLYWRVVVAQMLSGFKKQACLYSHSLTPADWLALCLSEIHIDSRWVLLTDWSSTRPWDCQLVIDMVSDLTSVSLGLIINKCVPRQHGCSCRVLLVLLWKTMAFGLCFCFIVAVLDRDFSFYRTRVQ